MPIHPKVAVSTIVAAVVAVVFWVLQDRGTVTSDQLVAGITALSGFVGGWLTPSGATLVAAPTAPFTVTPQPPASA